mgnify:CR=1 FL=1
MKILLLSVLVVAMIGLTVQSASAEREFESISIVDIDFETNREGAATTITFYTDRGMSTGNYPIDVKITEIFKNKILYESRYTSKFFTEDVDAKLKEPLALDKRFRIDLLHNPSGISESFIYPDDILKMKSKTQNSSYHSFNIDIPKKLKFSDGENSASFKLKDNNNFIAKVEYLGQNYFGKNLSDNQILQKVADAENSKCTWRNYYTDIPCNDFEIIYEDIFIKNDVSQYVIAYESDSPDALTTYLVDECSTTVSSSGNQHPACIDRSPPPESPEHKTQYYYAIVFEKNNNYWYLWSQIDIDMLSPENAKSLPKIFLSLEPLDKSSNNIVKSSPPPSKPAESSKPEPAIQTSPELPVTTKQYDFQTKTYVNSEMNFSVTHPADFQIDYFKATNQEYGMVIFTHPDPMQMFTVEIIEYDDGVSYSDKPNDVKINEIIHAEQDYCKYDMAEVNCSFISVNKQEIIQNGDITKFNLEYESQIEINSMEFPIKNQYAEFHTKNSESVFGVKLTSFYSTPIPDEYGYGESLFNLLADSFTLLNEETNSQSEVFTSIPTWIKNNAGWWAEGQIDDNSFVQGIQFMIKENIISIPNLPESSSETAESVPAWVKNNAGWWAEGQIDDNSFVQGIEYLVKVGIIKVN